MKEPQAPPQAPSGEKEGKVETDQYAGTNIDPSQMGQMQEQMMQGGKDTPKVDAGATRNKPSMSVGPDKRASGLPKEAGNQNVDKRTETR